MKTFIPVCIASPWFLIRRSMAQSDLPTRRSLQETIVRFRRSRFQQHQNHDKYFYRHQRQNLHESKAQANYKGIKTNLLEQKILYYTVPGSDADGFVSPSIFLPVATAPRPSQTMHVTGPDIMYSIREGKKGLELRSA